MRLSKLKTAVVWILALGLVAWTLRAISLEDALAALGRLDPLEILVLVLVNAAALTLFTSRWWFIATGLGMRLGFLRACAYRLAAFGFAYATPGPQVGGEPVQVLLLERKHGVARGRAVASVALDRVIDAVVNFGFLGVALAVLVTPLALPIALLAPLYLWSLARGARPVSRFFSRWPVVEVSEEEAGRFCREHPGYLALALMATLASWVTILADYWLSARFLGFALSWHALVLGVAAARVAYLLFFPAAVGALEAGQVAAVTAMGLPPYLGISLSLVARARDIFLASAGVLMGLGWLAPLRTSAAERLRSR